ncbi:Olfactory receptor 2W3 [Cricetulus griseus]|uniref:Olfactory receptor 2W3 n=1 Tax=Cricetulus griseus TaxID=10029 RepID=G3I8J4_CRIGR|nr:Olfactory receptor 2W3 [Cricetulus griseus]
MGTANDSTFSHFILLGFSDRPQLERVLFAVILPAYLLTLLGNSTIILVSRLDPHLHTPMYFFLTHLSFLDLSFTSSSIPQLLYNLRGQDKTISYVGCALQLVLFLGLGGVECLLLAVMAYDRFVAVCKPLHYMVVMSPKLCVGLVAVAWGLEGTVFVLAIGIVLSPLVFILVSYGYIVKAVLQIRSAAGRQKAFNTCGSHLTVVSLFYGNIIYMYMQPRNSSSQDQGKFLTLLYNISTPLLNPLIYTLRNKEVKGALRRLLLGSRETKEIRAGSRQTRGKLSW